MKIEHSVGSRYLGHFWTIIRLYGPIAPLQGVFLSRKTWRAAAQVLGEMDDQNALSFKKSVQGEGSIIAIAAALVGQLSITALSIRELDRIHWITQGFLGFSFVSALSAVYYATILHIKFGQLLTPKNIRRWIRGGSGTFYFRRLSLPQRVREELAVGHNIRQVYQLVSETIILNTLCEPCELKSTALENAEKESRRTMVKHFCFTPAIPSLIIISAPIALLTASLASMLIALGTYFGMIYTKQIKINTGPHSDRNIFIVYIVSLGVCIPLYYLMYLILDDAPKAEEQIIEEYIKKYEDEHPERAKMWLDDGNVM